MGDRANVVIKDRDDVVFLYTHWTGTELPATVKDALERGKDRWDDAPYLARIIFCEMVKGSEMDLTGFGISSKLTDHNWPLLVLDIPSQTVSFCEIKRDPENHQETFDLETGKQRQKFVDFNGQWPQRNGE